MELDVGGKDAVLQLESGLTQVPDEAFEVHEVIHIRDEEAMDFGHVGDVLHQ